MSAPAYQQSGGGDDDALVFPVATPLVNYARVAFLDRPEAGSELECSICMDVVFRPPNLECPHLFCRKCILGARAAVPAARRNVCPTCSTSYAQSSQTTNAFVLHLIAQLRVACPRADQGCTYQGPLGTDNRNWLQHEAQCALVVGACRACKQAVRRGQTVEHLAACKPYACRHCGECVPGAAHDAHRTSSSSSCVNMEVCRASDQCKAMVVRGHAGAVAHAATCAHRVYCRLCRQDVAGSAQDHQVKCHMEASRGGGGGGICAICHNQLKHHCIVCDPGAESGPDAPPPKEGKKCAVASGMCGHVYHAHCINRWLRTRDTCPLDDVAFVAEVM
jgi:hypothetical protein